MAKPTTESGLVKSDETLFTVLEGLQELDGAGVTELAAHIGLSKSAVHKHLKTLHKNEYLVKDGTKYKLAFKFLTIGGWVRDTNPLFSVSEQKTRELSEEINESVTFSVREFDEAVHVYRVQDRYESRKFIPIGTSFPLHSTAGGKAMLASLSDDEIEDYVENHGLSSLTQHTVTNLDEFWDEIVEIRERRYATNAQENVDKFQGVGAALQHEESNMLGAITVYGPTVHFTTERIEDQLSTKLLRVVDELNIMLKHMEHI